MICEEETPRAVCQFGVMEFTGWCERIKSEPFFQRDAGTGRCCCCSSLGKDIVVILFISKHRVSFNHSTSENPLLLLSSFAAGFWREELGCPKFETLGAAWGRGCALGSHPARAGPEPLGQDAQSQASPVPGSGELVPHREGLGQPQSCSCFSVPVLHQRALGFHSSSLNPPNLNWLRTVNQS